MVFSLSVVSAFQLLPTAKIVIICGSANSMWRVWSIYPATTFRRRHAPIRHLNSANQNKLSAFPNNYG